MMNFTPRIIPVASVLLLIWGAGNASAQSCSCAGAPLLSSQTISATSGGNLLMGLTYEYHDISNIYSGTNKLDKNLVERTTQTALLEVSYGITDRLTLSGTFTFIRKSRTTGFQNVGDPTQVIARGLGDGILMAKYVLHQNTIRSQYQLALGGGAKIPFGATNRKRDDLFLNVDMQPGTGAWDGVLWSYFSKTFAPHTTLNVFWVNSFRMTGSSTRNADSKIPYKFGNEFQSVLGGSDNLAGSLSYILLLRYRSSSSDNVNGEVQPNTGGKWISISPGLRYDLSPAVALQVTSRIPVYQDLNGIQPTTRYTLKASLQFNFAGNTIF